MLQNQTHRPSDGASIEDAMDQVSFEDLDTLLIPAGASIDLSFFFRVFFLVLMARVGFFQIAFREKALASQIQKEGATLQDLQEETRPGTYRTFSTLPGSPGGWIGVPKMEESSPMQVLCKGKPHPQKVSFKVLSLPPCLVLLELCGEFMYTPEI